MDLLQAARERHSVRVYRTDPLPDSVVESLRQKIDECNARGGLTMRLVTEEPGAFECAIARYGTFAGVRNYVVVSGPQAPDLQERAGYFGEHVVLFAQALGLNTCWVALTYAKGMAKRAVDPQSKLVCTIALGYGANQGKPRKSKRADQVSNCTDASPKWFAQGVECALLAPTAVNQQRFFFELLDGESVSARATGGFYSGIDLGIAKCHFEIGAHPHAVTWR